MTNILKKGTLGSMSAYDLIDWLDKAYPERCPATEDRDREIWYYSGQRALVTGLIHKLKQEEA